MKCEDLGRGHHFLSYLGQFDDLLWKLGKCSGPKKGRNAGRALRRLIQQEGLCIPVDLDFVEVTCRRRKPKVQNVSIQWPVLPMKHWVQFLLHQHPGLLLGGRSWQEDWKGLHKWFWNCYKEIEPDHEIFSSGKPLTNCIPYLTHGDEGQTLRKTAFMVQSWQPMISWQGEDVTTMSGILGSAKWAAGNFYFSSASFRGT